MAKNTTQADFDFKKTLRVTFDGGVISGDGGLPLVRQLDDHLGLTRRFAEALHDPRNPVFITHPAHDLVRSRVYGILHGYEDCNDFGHLRSDVLFKAACDRLDGDPELPSQPTLSRFENRATLDDLMAGRETLLEHFIRRWKIRFERPRSVTLDVDTTDDPTHGQQQFSAFNAYYDTHCYMQLLVHSEEGDLLSATLLPNVANARSLAVSHLDHLVSRLRSAWPEIRIRIRADNGFACPELYDFCEGQRLEYIVNAGSNASFQEKAVPLLEQAERLFAEGGASQTARVFGEFQHQAKSWRQPRRIIAKAQRTPLGPDSRFLVTNLNLSPANVYANYARRGQEENWIKDLKRALKSDRLSCTRFKANFLRLLLFALAYQLGHELRRRAPPQFRTAQLDTFRLHFLRVPALVHETARKLWVRISSTYPWRLQWLELARSVASLSG